MKSMKRALALFITVLMVATSLLSVSSFAAVQFPDVEDNNPYRSAIYSLVGKGVINGIAQEDGSFLFKPDATITRAEFAKMIAVAVTGNASLTETTTKFPDVPETHWANTYIAYAVKAGIINGRDDGTFRPENPVTYGEAIKMVVCAKGYGSLYKQNEGEAWYQGYIKVANDVNLTKNAVALGTAEASRGMVAQLIYNMDYAKNVTTGGGSGGPSIDLGEDDDYEEGSGAVTAAFERSLTGEEYGLTKFQIMVDDVVYNLEGIDVERFYDYLGVEIEFLYYEEGSKNVITNVLEWGINDVLVINGEDIESISSDVIEYYKDENTNKISEAKLSDNLYVVYNGQGVPQREITSSFIKQYFDVDCGEIRLENNDGGKDYEVAYVTNYETYFVTGRTVSKDIYTFNDAYKSKSIALENDDDDYVVYKVTTEGGSKTSSTVSGIGSSKVVLSVAKPLTDGVTQAIASTVTLKNAEVTEMSDYDEVYIMSGGDEKRYVVSDYYMEFIESDPSTYGFKVGDVATFYLDYAGRIVYMAVAETTEPYAYVLGYDPGSGLDGTKAIKLFAISGTKATTVEYPVKSTVKVNGSNVDSSSLESVLKANARRINSKLGQTTLIENGEYAQLIKFATANVNGVTHLSEIYTIDSANPASGYVIPAPYNSGGSDKDVFSYGGELTYNSTSKAFTYGGSNQFVVNSSTAIIFVPSDRADYDGYRKSTPTNNKKYVAEPYDVKNNVAKAVLIYTLGSNSVFVDGSTDASLICGISSAKNPDTGEVVNKISYIKVGDAATEDKIQTIYTADLNGIVSGINPGDVVKFAVENGEVEKIQKVFVDGKLYDYDDSACFDTYLASGNVIEHEYGGDRDYYRVILGTVDSVDIDGSNLSVVPQVVNNNDDYSSNWESFNMSSSTKMYIYDSESNEFSSEADLGALNGATNGDIVDAISASKVLVIVKSNTVRGIYILDHLDF